MVMVAILAPLRRAIERLRDERMTKPESQKTGMDTIQPMMLMARAGRFSPTCRRTVSAMVTAPPLLSSIAPMIVPNRMTMLMERHVFPKPAAMVT